MKNQVIVALLFVIALLWYDSNAKRAQIDGLKRQVDLINQQVEQVTNDRDQIKQGIAAMAEDRDEMKAELDSEKAEMAPKANWIQQRVDESSTVLDTPAATPPPMPQP
jgi:uncharacterized coiled-coil DUF342 family protein